MLHLRDHLAFLASISGIGNRTIFRLISALKKREIEWSNFWVLSSSQYGKVGLTERQISSILESRKEHTPYSYKNWLKIREMRVIGFDDAEYPPLLKKSDNFPAILFAKGTPMSWKNVPVVAVVGARNMTAYGEQVTSALAGGLSRCGATIVSGFMYGVDCAAHRAALESNGSTVGVLGYGHDFVYPENQKDLMQQWLEQGMTFISPFAPSVAPKRGNFPARNRVVAAMSHAVVVTEAAEKSGSLITAGYAAQEGRVVCAVPGPITNPYTRGTRELINQGAVLVGGADEVLLEIEASYPDLLDKI